MKQILISGYYGFENAGDEAVLSGLIVGLRNNAPASQLEIAALSIAPKNTEYLHQITAKHRYKELLPALLKTDLLLSGGGSLLQDVTSAHGIFYYLAVVRIAQIMGCKTMFVAQGIGPLTRKRSIKLTASVANGLDAIAVRDNASCELLQSIGVTKTINITADPALLLDPGPHAKQDGILLSMRKWKESSSQLESDLARALLRIALPRRVEALNMYGDNDAEAADHVIRQLHYPGYNPVQGVSHPDFRRLLGSVAASEMVIGMRLHALIFAAAAGVSAVGLSYDPKVTAFMHQLGQDDAVSDISPADTNILSATIGAVWKTRQDRAEAIKKKLLSIRPLAQRNADIAYHLLR